MPKIHRIAAVGVGSVGDEPHGRLFQAGAAATVLCSVESAQAVLQITPEHERQKNEIDAQAASV